MHQYVQRKKLSSLINFDNSLLVYLYFLFLLFALNLVIQTTNNSRFGFSSRYIINFLFLSIYYLFLNINFIIFYQLLLVMDLISLTTIDDRMYLMLNLLNSISSTTILIIGIDTLSFNVKIVLSNPEGVPIVSFK